MKISRAYRIIDTVYGKIGVAFYDPYIDIKQHYHAQRDYCKAGFSLYSFVIAYLIYGWVTFGLKDFLYKLHFIMSGFRLEFQALLCGCLNDMKIYYPSYHLYNLSLSLFFVDI